jgi:Ca-activated chloride channel family protein
MNRIGIVPLALLLAGFSPLKAEHPGVEKGNRALSSGDAEAALREYDQAATELGSPPEIEYNRGNALFRLKRFQEAREAYGKALAGPESLQARDYFNLGNALVQLGSADDAMKAYRRALALDQKNEDARYNLEVLLRRQQEEQQKKKEQKQESQQQNDKQEQQKKDDPQQNGKQDQQKGEQQKDEKRQDPGQGEGKRDEKAEAARDGEKQDRDSESRGGRKQRPEVSRQEAERLLDAMRAREQNMPVSRSRPRELGSNRVEKDW